MPQEINILQCYKCLIYQTQIVKKSKTWTCKVCNEKQSMKRSYGQGSGKECRERVQQLNSMRQEAEEMVPETELEEQTLHSENEEENSNYYSAYVEDTSEVPKNSGFTQSLKKESKWAKYLDIPVDQESDSN